MIINYLVTGGSVCGRCSPWRRRRSRQEDETRKETKFVKETSPTFSLARGVPADTAAPSLRNWRVSLFAFLLCVERKIKFSMSNVPSHRLSFTFAAIRAQRERCWREIFDFLRIDGLWHVSKKRETFIFQFNGSPMCNENEIKFFVHERLVWRDKVEIGRSLNWSFMGWWEGEVDSWCFVGSSKLLAHE